MMGREFDQLFDTWAESYDDTVAGVDIEYKEVFYRYEEILNSVAEKVSGTVMEFGVGTGNLTQKLVKRNVKVIGIEPSQNMRKIAKEKIKNIDLHDGDFLNFPIPRKPLDAIVTTYAFHHLNDEEKFQAI